MEDVSKSGRTILFVSHNMAAVLSLCNNALLINNGKIIEHGAAEMVVSKYLLGSAKAKGDRSNQQLAGGVTVINFSLSNDLIATQETLQFSFNINSNQINRISDLSILFYNNLNERVGIIDLRNKELIEKSSIQNEIHIDVLVDSVPLVEGIYHIGLYISSVYCQGDFYQLAQVEILKKETNYVPYDIKYRGYAEFKTNFHIS